MLHFLLNYILKYLPTLKTSGQPEKKETRKSATKRWLAKIGLFAYFIHFCKFLSNFCRRKRIFLRICHTKKICVLRRKHNALAWKRNRKVFKCYIFSLARLCTIFHPRPPVHSFILSSVCSFLLLLLLLFFRLRQRMQTWNLNSKRKVFFGKIYTSQSEVCHRPYRAIWTQLKKRAATNNNNKTTFRKVLHCSFADSFSCRFFLERNSSHHLNIARQRNVNFLFPLFTKIYTLSGIYNGICIVCNVIA